MYDQTSSITIMGKLSTFHFITLDGFYKSLTDDIGWHRHGAEEGQFSAENLKANNILLFGRATYEMMYSFWPSPMAAEAFPEVAIGMNDAEKIVFSNTLPKAEWNNTILIKDHLIEEVKRLKRIAEKNMTILGSGSIVAQLAAAGLIDEYQIMIDPVAIGSGTPLFAGILQPLNLKLISTRTFKSGAVLLCYKAQE